MKKLISFILFCLPVVFSFGQVVKTAAVPYTKTTGFIPSLQTSSELRVDTTCSCLYWWDRDNLAWMRFRPGADVISGSAAPAYTPRDNQSLFAVNADSEVYYFNGATWDLVGGGAPDGNGIYGGSGNVPDGTTATLLGDFDISEPTGAGSFSGQIGTTGGAFWSFAQDSTIFRYFDVAGNNDLVFGAGGLTVRTPATGDRLTILGRDARYSADYSAGFSDRSLIDKGFADGAYKSIYTGNGTLFTGGANVTFSGSNPLRFHRAGSSSTPIVQKLFSSGTTGYFDRYRINNDSLDWIYALGRFSLLTFGSALTLAPEGELLLAGSSIKYQAGSVAEVNEADFIGAETSSGTVERIAGTATGQVLVWDDTAEKWELGAMAGAGLPEFEIAYGNAAGDGLDSSPGFTYDGATLQSDADLEITKSAALAILIDTDASGVGSGGDLFLSSQDGAALSDGDRCGGVQFIGNTGISGANVGALIEGFADGNWSGTDSPGKLVVSTVPNGSLTPAPRIVVRENGAIELPDYGTGTYTGTPAYALQVDASGNLIEGSVSVGSAAETNAQPVVYPSQITATTNDYSPTGYSTTVSQTIQVDGDTLFRTITGLSAATRNGVEKTFDNDGAACYVIAKQHTGSSAANRFDINKDVVMLPGMQATFRYDSVGQRWRLKNTNRDNVSFNSVVQEDYKFINASTANGLFQHNNSGGTSTPSGADNTNFLRIGTLVTGSVATSFPSISVGTNPFFISANNTYFRMSARVKVSALSTAAEDYDVRMGFKNSLDTNITEGAYISYQYEVNSGGWTILTHDGSTPGTTNAGGAIVAATYYNLELIYYPYGEVTAFVNNVRYTTTSNLPTLLSINPFLMIDKDNGATTRTLSFTNLEYWGCYVKQ